MTSSDGLPSATLHPQGVLMLVEEISHRVANDYARAIARIRLASRVVDDPRARSAMEGAADFLQACAQSHHALRAPGEAAEIDLAAHLEEICACLSRTILEPAGVRLMLVQMPASVPAAIAWRVGLVVAELVANAVRHGLGTGGGRVRVEMVAAANGVGCTVSDNGGVRVAPHVGRGRRLVRALIEEVGGNVQWRFGPCGTTVEFHAPRAPPVG